MVFIYVASKLYGVNATIIIFVFVLYCIVCIYFKTKVLAALRLVTFLETSVTNYEETYKLKFYENKLFMYLKND